MSKNHITLQLTRMEATVLLRVADNGWGNGDFANWLNNSAQSKACIRAMLKLSKKLHEDIRTNRRTERN